MFHALAIAVSLLAAPDPWVVIDEVSPVDGRRTYIAGVEAQAPVGNDAGRPETPMLAFGCIDQRLSVTITWPAYLGRDEVRVEWRAGSGEPTETVFQAVGGEVAMLQDFPAERFMDQVRGADRVAVRVTGYRQQSEAVFMTPDVALQIDRAREVCR
jgi:hypothetical protein